MFKNWPRHQQETVVGLLMILLFSFVVILFMVLSPQFTAGIFGFMGGVYIGTLILEQSSKVVDFLTK